MSVFLRAFRALAVALSRVWKAVVEGARVPPTAGHGSPPQAAGVAVDPRAGSVRAHPLPDSLRFSRKPRLRGVPHAAMPLQIRAVSELFAKLGVLYVPPPLVHRLRLFDVVSALQTFLDAFGMDYEALVTPSHVDHWENRRRLERVVALLAAAEQSVRGTRLSADSIGAAVQVSAESAEALLAKLEKVGAVWRLIGQSPLSWKRFGEFRVAAHRTLEAWQDLSEQELNDIFTTLRDYEALGRRVAEATASATAVLARAQANGLGDGAHRIAEAARTRIGELNQALESADDPALIVKELESLLEDLRTAFGAEPPSDAGGSVTSRCRDALGVLGLDESATLAVVKRRWRQLVLRYHPDRNPGDPGAEARMRELNAAHDYLETRSADCLAPEGGGLSK